MNWDLHAEIIWMCVDIKVTSTCKFSGPWSRRSEHMGMGKITF